MKRRWEENTWERYISLDIPIVKRGALYSTWILGTLKPLLNPWSNDYHWLVIYCLYSRRQLLSTHSIQKRYTSLVFLKEEDEKNATFSWLRLYQFRIMAFFWLTHPEFSPQAHIEDRIGSSTKRYMLFLLYLSWNNLIIIF